MCQCLIAQKVALLLIFHETRIVQNQTSYVFSLTRNCQYLCSQTNDHHDLCKEHDRHMSSAKMVKWKPLAVAEYYVMALLMLMEPVKKCVLKEYWITSDLTSTAAFTKYLSHDRFVDILLFLHFADSRVDPNEEDLWKLCFVLGIYGKCFLNFSSLFKT